MKEASAAAMRLTDYHAKYFAHDLTRRAASGMERLSMSLFDAAVDLNSHQIEAALFALESPLSKGVILADEVGLGKTIADVALDLDGALPAGTVDSGICGPRYSASHAPMCQRIEKSPHPTPRPRPLIVDGLEKGKLNFYSSLAFIPITPSVTMGSGARERCRAHSTLP
jgi:hypothetical protein